MESILVLKPGFSTANLVSLVKKPTSGSCRTTPPAEGIYLNFDLLSGFLSLVTRHLNDLIIDRCESVSSVKPVFDWFVLVLVLVLVLGITPCSDLIECPPACPSRT